MTQPISMANPPRMDAVHASGDIASDPLRAISRLGKRAARDGIYIGFIVALLSHTAALAYPDVTTWEMALVAADMRSTLHAYFWQEFDVVVDEAKKVDEPPPPEEEEAVIEEPEEPETTPEPQVQAPEPDEPEEKDDSPYPDEDEAPPPAAAADTLTQDDDAQDMTGEEWGVVDQDGSKETGTGYVSSEGKGSEPVRNPNARVGSEGRPDSKGRGKKKRRKSRPKPNLSRGLGGNYRANCPHPPQAELHQVDKATVQLLVTVASDGTVKSASVLSDPGYGFGQQAKRCVMAQKFPPALDAEGRPISKTGALNYRFDRR